MSPCKSRFSNLVTNNFVSMKQGSLFYFVLFIMLGSPKPQCFMYLCFCIFEKHQLGLRHLELWCGSYWLLNHFFQCKLNKIEIENNIEILGAFLVLLESPWQVRFNRVYFTILRAKVWKILVFEWIENWVLIEKSDEASMCSHCWIFKFSILKMWKLKNVFTLGPMTQATLVYNYMLIIYNLYFEKIHINLNYL